MADPTYVVTGNPTILTFIWDEAGASDPNTLPDGDADADPENQRGLDGGFLRRLGCRVSHGIVSLDVALQ
jgi:hypothetical protein